MNESSHGAKLSINGTVTSAGWYMLGYCPDAHAHLHHVVGWLDACCLDQQRELGR
jgi:hypothetical protein